MPFVEALTQLRHKVGKGNFVNIQVSYVPVINGEQKTKPTQHAVKSIRSAGLIPDLVGHSITLLRKYRRLMARVGCLSLRDSP
jgi:CTP synthase (UTP-ammonia lyase)